MIVCNFVYLLFVSIYLVVQKSCTAIDVTVSTYNLWNVMFNWEVRKYRIAEMIRESNADVIVFQEVRMNFFEDKSQVSDLKKLIPEFRWSMWRSATKATGAEDYVNIPWQREGLGILSKKPILDVSVQNLPYSRGPDTNRRIAVHASISLSRNTVINVIAVHLSYDRQQQCQNVAALLEFVRLKRMKNNIILGDFNTYIDYEDPVRVFTDRVMGDSNRCASHVKTESKPPALMFVDTWLHGPSHGRGFTFSNMPTPGYESRPDRILVSKSNFDVKSSSLTGNGTIYKKHFKGAIKFKRIRSVIKNSFYALRGYVGFSCTHDCGPRGVCRCGICTRGGHSVKCDLPDCEECDGKFFLTFLSYFTLLLSMIVAFIFSLLKVLIVSAKFNPETFFSIMGCTCCLFNPQLYSFQRLSSRHRFLKVCSPVARLPPMALLFLSVILLVIVVLIGESVFKDGFHLVDEIMDEEFFPSDHLMYTVQLAIKS